MGHEFISFKSLNPANQEIVWEGVEASTEEIEEAISVAQQAALSWHLLGFEARKNLVLTFQKELETHAEEGALLVSQETGKPLWETRQEISAAIAKCSISIDAYQQRTGTHTVTLGSTQRTVTHAPIGVMAILGPFNFPIHLLNGHMIPALLAGNTVIVKPSEKTPASGEWLIKLWQKLGLPKGVIQLIQGARTVGETLSSHPKIDAVCFTGSVKVGQAIALANTKTPQKLLALEMGGNNPLIVSSVSDTSKAVLTLIQSAFISSGQRCTCARRVILLDTVANHELIDALKAHISTIRIGPYDSHPEPFMGPLIDENAAKAALQFFETLHISGGIPLVNPKLSNSTFVSPGLIDTSLVKQPIDTECFGPILQVKWVKNLEDAVKEANNTAFGLAAGLLSDSSADFDYVFNRIKAGVINWNCPTVGSSSTMPFGGVKSSGNYRPSAFYAADYCAYPLASTQNTEITPLVTPGIDHA